MLKMHTYRANIMKHFNPDCLYIKDNILVLVVNRYNRWLKGCKYKLFVRA